MTTYIISRDWQHQFDNEHDWEWHVAEACRMFELEPVHFPARYAWRFCAQKLEIAGHPFLLIAYQTKAMNREVPEYTGYFELYQIRTDPTWKGSTGPSNILNRVLDTEWVQWEEMEGILSEYKKRDELDKFEEEVNRRKAVRFEEWWDGCMYLITHESGKGKAIHRLEFAQQTTWRIFNQDRGNT